MQVWLTCNPAAAAFLTKAQFFAAMRLISMAQHGLPVSQEALAAHAHDALPPVKLDGLPAWVVVPADKSKYDMVFDRQDADKDGFVMQPEAIALFLQSGLPQEVRAAYARKEWAA